ncbi:MAG: transposase [Myxococcota bacterium]
MTLKVRRGVPSLRSVRFVREMERTFSGACERGWFRVTHYSIQRDHVHLVVEAKSAEALGRGMKSIGARFARAVNRVFRRSGRVQPPSPPGSILRPPAPGSTAGSGVPPP